MEIVELRALVAVVERGSFTDAAQVLDTDKAHVSRIVSRLEKKLGAQLLQRSTRRINVTEVGREVYERAAGVLCALEETAASVAKSQGTPSGTLKVTAGPEFGVLVVNDWIAQFLKAYPDVNVSAEYTNRVTDVIHEGFDVAIRVGPLPDSELSARRIGEVDYGFFASPDHPASRAQLEDPRALESYDLVMFTPRGTPMWKVVRARDVREITSAPRYQVNNNISAMEMAVAGVGATLLPKFMAAKNVETGLLFQLLPEWAPVPAPVHAVFASSRYMAPKVRAFVDLAVAHFKTRSV